MTTTNETPDESTPDTPMLFLRWVRQMPRAFAYPLRLRGVGFMLTGGIVWGLADALPWPLSMISLTAAWIFIGFLYAYLFNIIQTSAAGDDKLPPIPIGADFVDEAVVPLLYVIGTLVVSYLPLLVILCLRERVDFLLVLLALVSAPYMFTFGSPDVYLAVLGTVYLPMGLLALAVHRDIKAISPHVVVPAVVRTFLPYACVALLFLGVTALHNHIMAELTSSFWGGGGDSSVPWLFDHIDRATLQFLLKPCLLYAYVVLARALGTIHWVYRRRLGWLERV